MSAGSPRGLMKQVIDFITFVNFPIRKKFMVFGLGVLFWLLILFTVGVSTIVVIRHKSNSIVHELIPRDKTAQKIMRDLQYTSADASEMSRSGDVRAVLKLAEASGSRIDDIHIFLTVLLNGGQVQDYDRSANTLKEAYVVAPLRGDKDGEEYLAFMLPLIRDVDKKIDEVAAARISVLNGTGDRARYEAGLAELKALLAKALDASDTYSVAVSRAYARNSGDIGFDFVCTFVTVIIVLAIAVALLVVFTIWLSNSITKPITSITAQIRSLGEGDISSLKPIEITSRDEIGVLSQEFNGLMDSISRLTSFKKLIEEDDSIEDVYLRLAHKFKHDFGLQELTIYEIANSQNKMRTVYPLGTAEDGMTCNQDILADCHLCRAKKTGHEVSSLAQPGVCKSFLTNTDREYICLPLITGGVCGGVVQFLIEKGALNGGS